MKWEKFPFKIEKQYRLRDWDYSSGGYYFITICTRDRINYLGKIKDGKITLTEIGKMAKGHWKEIPKHFENIVLDKFVIMPNHIHGILIIENECICRNMPWHVPTKTDGNNNRPWHVPTKMKNDRFINKFSVPVSKSISMAINHFKGAVKRECNQHEIKFDWQLRFHDRIIRDRNEYWAKRIYIRDNIKNWGKEKDDLLYY